MVHSYCAVFPIGILVAELLIIVTPDSEQTGWHMLKMKDLVTHFEGDMTPCGALLAGIDVKELNMCRSNRLSGGKNQADGQEDKAVVSDCHWHAWPRCMPNYSYL